MDELDFYFDIYSPYAYLGFHRLLQIAEAHSYRINFHPVDLKQLKVAAGNTGPANVEIPPKIKYLMVDLKRWAERYGLPFGSIPRAKNYARINSGVFYAQQKGGEVDYIKAAYALVWGRGGDADDDSELRAIATSLGWDVADFMAYIASTEAESCFGNSIEKAIDNGVFGVPTVVIGADMWWGNDRMDFLEEALRC